MKRTVAVLAMLLAASLALRPAPLIAQDNAQDTAPETVPETVPETAPETAPATAPAGAFEGGPEGTPQPQPAAGAVRKAEPKPCPPGLGCVTNLPLPRFVSLKGKDGNARRGPGLTHRIDWVFIRPGMPLRITAEYENWRRVEDFEGAGGWVHYALLSGARTAMVTLDMAELRNAPSDDATVVAQAETGVIGQIMECQTDWCRVALDGQRGWIRKTAIWGVTADEVFD